MAKRRTFDPRLSGDIHSILSELIRWIENCLSPAEKAELRTALEKSLMRSEETQVYVCNECDGIVPEDQLPQEENWTCPHCGECSELRLAAANWVTTDEDRAWLRQIKVRPQ